MQKLKDLLCDVLECNDAQLTNETKFVDTESWSSLKYMTLVMQLEETFSISLSAEDIQKLTSLNEVNNILKSKGVAG